MNDKQLIEFYEKELAKIASFNHHHDDVPQWYIDELIEIHGPDYMSELGFNDDITELHQMWRDDHAHYDHDHMVQIIEIARLAIKKESK